MRAARPLTNDDAHLRAQIEWTIRPALGRTPLSRLTPKYLDDLYAFMKERGVSPKTIRKHHAIISSALRQEVGGDG